MTLKRYSSQDLDKLCLRTLDICSKIRALSREARDQEIAYVPLNDKKALEWLAALEGWLPKAEADLGVRIAKARGKRLAREAR
jgi:hypothetical protein